MRRTDRLGADDDVIDASIQVTLNGVLVTDTATHLNLHVRVSLADGMDHLAIPRLAGKGTIQIHQVQTLGAIGHPLASHGDRIVRKHRIVFHAALPQTDTLAIFQVDSRYQKHGKLLISE